MSEQNLIGAIAPNLVIDQETTAYQQAFAETQDDPTLTVDLLSEEERRKIRIQYVAATHTDQYDAAIAQAMGPVNYCVSEVVLGSEAIEVYGSRRGYDVGMNLLGRDQTVSIGGVQTEGQEANQRVLASNLLFSKVVTLAQEAERELPIFRSFDVDATVPSPPSLIDRFQTLGAVSAYCDTLMMKRYTDAFYLDPNRVLIHDKYELVTLLNETGKHRELLQPQDLSVIIANAVRRHPEQEKIAFGVMVGASHFEAHEEFVEQAQLQSDVQFVPPPDETQRFVTASSLLERATRSGELPSQAELERDLLYDYLEQLTTPGYPYTYRPEAKVILRKRMQEFSEDDVRGHLETIDRIKQETAANPPSIAEDVSQELRDYVVSTAIYESIKQFVKTMPDMETAISRINAINLPTPAG